MKKVFLFCAALVVCTCVTAQEWAQWRGPKGDGISQEKDWNPAALKNVKVKWQKELGVGYSIVSVSGGKAYTMGNQDGSDVIYCLDANTGKTEWTHKYSCRTGNYKGPRATPAVSDGNVYTLSREGHAFCLDAKTGKVKWEKNLLQEGGQKLGWGLAGSPLVMDGRVIYNTGKNGIALDAKTGRKAWGSNGAGGFATCAPIPGKSLIAVFSKDKVVLVSPSSGSSKGSFDWVTKHNVNAADPVSDGKIMFISSGYGRGCAMLDISSRPKKLWENTSLKAHFSSPVLIDGHIYGIDGQSRSNGKLVCLDAKSGQVKWSQGVGFGGLMAADGKLVVLNENGKLFIAAASPSGYKEFSSGQTPLGKLCWTPPVLCGGTIYCRQDSGKLVAVDVSK